MLPERRGAPRAGRLLRDRGRRARAPHASTRQTVPGRSTFSATHIGIDEYDVANQGLDLAPLSPVDGRWEIVSMPFRYVWPSELDLMARLAGMTLRERWSGWNREPFTSESTKHVSVWEKPA